jgi:Rrf2 family protein
MNAFLPQTAEYALRATAWLAARAEPSPVRAKELSEGTGIPLHYLSKILRRLVLADLLLSQKGHHGGFVLARPPGEISFREILTAVNGFPTPRRCSFGWGSCDKTKPCPLHEPWSEMADQFSEWASTTTLDRVKKL